MSTALLDSLSLSDLPDELVMLARALVKGEVRFLIKGKEYEFYTARKTTIRLRYGDCTSVEATVRLAPDGDGELTMQVVAVAEVENPERRSST